MNSVNVAGEDNTSLLTALRSTVLLIVICGGLYPAFTVLVGQALFPEEANGSLIRIDGEVVGSELVGQPFVSDRYFYGRPSAADYKPFHVAASQMAPMNPELHERVLARAKVISEREGIPMSEIPVDLVAASGSGIDPHISPASAAIQIPRVAAARGLDEAVVRELVEKYTQPPTFGVLGQPRVNVLLLNLALDALAKEKAADGAGG